MRQLAMAICIALVLLLGQALADTQGERAEAALHKAEVLEQEVADEGDKTPSDPPVIITKPEAQAVDPAGEKPLDDAVTCLARAVYWEAKGESLADMEAVANVVMNRLGHEGFPTTVCGVVRQGGEQGSCQFSWWCDGRSDAVEEEKRYAIAKEIARKALNRQLEDRTGGALYFHQRLVVSPSWATEYLKTAEIGEFVFYKPRHGTAR